MASGRAELPKLGWIVLFKNTCIILVLFIAAIAFCWSSAAAGNEPLLPRNEPTFQAIIKATTEPNRDIRMRAANALGMMGREDAVPALKALAVDPVPAVRAAALRALCNLLPTGSSLEIMLEVPVEDRTLRSTALYAAAKLSFDQRDTLIKTALESGTTQEKVAAVLALEMDAAADAWPLLQVALQEPDAVVRAEAIRRLAKSDDEEARALLLDTVNDKSAADSFIVRAVAVEVLGRIKDDALIPRFAVASGDEHYLVRRAATVALASFAGSSQAVAAVRKGLSDDDFTVRVAACDSLGILVDNSSAEALSDRLADDRSEVRDAAEKALMKLSPNDAYKYLLRHTENTTEADIRQRAWHVLGEYAHPATVEMAFRALRDEDVIVSGHAIRILRMNDDRRMLPFLTETVMVAPTVISGIQGATPDVIVPAGGNLQVVEGLKAAAQFGVRDYIEFARTVLQRGHTRAGIGLWPPHVVQAAAARYVADMGDTDSVGLLKRLYEKRKTSAIGGDIRDAVKRLTGEDLPIPVDDTVRYGDFFIEVTEVTQ